jgi:hypothetical protein
MPAQSVTIGTTRGLAARPVLLVVTGLCVFGSPAYSQTGEGKTSSCPGNYDLRVGSQSHLLGNWCGERTRLEQRGVRFDFQYVSDTLWGFKSQQNSQFASWNRFRATVDIDFGKLSGQDGLLLPRDRTHARRRQLRTGSGASDRAQQPGEFQHDPP